MDVLEKAKELGEALANSAVFQRMKAAEEAQAKDEIATKMLAEYNQKTNEFAAKVKAKQPTKEELEFYRDTLHTEFEKLMQNATIAEFIASKKEFDDLMKKMNRILSSYVTPQEESTCSGSCSSCGGCH